MYTDIRNIKKQHLAGRYSPSPYYRDYRYLQDDKTVLKNPHKGWYWHFVDNGFSRIPYRDPEIIKDYTGVDFPCLNHLYIRFDWGDIEKEEGCLDWSPIDDIIEKWAPLGYKFTFRLCCFEGPGIPYATPEWVKKAGAKGTMCPGDANGEVWEPDYGDPIFLQKLEAFMKQYGEKFNGNPLIEYIDVGTYGTWGEGHTGYGTGISYPTEVIIKHTNLHLKYFPDTFILTNDDIINASKNEKGIMRQYLLDYSVGKGLGLRDDSIKYVNLVNGMFEYSTLMSPFMFDRFYKQAPIDLECTHVRETPDDCEKEGLPVLEAARRAHASYCGFHGYPEAWYKNKKYFTEYLANRLGYWYFIDAAEIPECVSGLTVMIKVWFKNKGFCHAYNAFDFKIKLTGKNGSYVIYEKNGLNLELEAESQKEMLLKASLKGVPEGEYDLCVGMFEGELPIKMGFWSETLCEDGYYAIDSVTVIGV